MKIFYILETCEVCGHLNLLKQKKTLRTSGFGGLEVVCWHLVPKFAGSNPAEAVGFFRTKKILTTPSFGREVKPFVHVVDLRHVKDP